VCLGVPGRIARIVDDHGLRMADIDFGGISRRACLAYVPDAEVDDFVIIHAGFAISKVDPEEAERALRLLDEIDRKLGEPNS
jgi:hydrogenase expression/formation protein HypC